MIYLSRLLLNPRSRQVQREARDPYQQHRTVMNAFPPTLPKQERVLYRLDTQPRTGQMTLLVQSQIAPDWGGLAGKDYLLPEDPFNDLPNPAVKAIKLSLWAGQTLGFRLRANPTKRLLHDDPERKLKKGQRIGLLKEEEQLAWLQRKAEQAGFTILSVTATAEGKQQAKIRRQDEPVYNLTHLAVRFDGVLQVVDPDRLLKALRCGIGSGKGLGFGLLSLARVR